MPSKRKLATHRERAVRPHCAKKGRRFGMAKYFLERDAIDLTSRGPLNSGPAVLKNQFY
jgi:hypothetical protein